MPLPSNYQTVPVHGKWLDLNGAALKGTVTFSIAQPLIDPGQLLVIMPAPITATLDAAGEVSLDLPATDDPDITPSGFTYQVSESFKAGGKRSYSIQVPADTDGTLELATVAPVEPVGAVSGLVTSSVVGQPGGVAALDGDGDVVDADGAKVVGGGGSGGAVDSVNGQTGAVTLDIPSEPSDIGAQPAGSYVTAAQGALADSATQPGDLDAYALTADVPDSTDFVALTGDQDVAGVKRFTSSPLVPTPQAGENDRVVNRGYVDALTAADVGALPDSTAIPDSAGDIGAMAASIGTDSTMAAYTVVVENGAAAPDGLPDGTVIVELA